MEGPPSGHDPDLAPPKTALDDTGTTYAALFGGWLPGGIAALVGASVVWIITRHRAAVWVALLGGTLAGYVVCLTLVFVVGSRLSNSGISAQSADRFLTLALLSGVPTALAIAALALIAVPLAILVSALAIGWVVLGIAYLSISDAIASRDAPPPPFSLELPDEWVGGYGDTGWIDALVKHARAYPEDHDRAFELLGILKGTEALFVACAVRGPDADLEAAADDMDPDGALSLDEELPTWVDDHLDMLATDKQLVGDPIVSIVDEPYAGRELRWSLSASEHPQFIVAYDSSCFATAGRLWTLEFSSVGFSPSTEASIQAIATSFHVPSRDIPATLGDDNVGSPAA